MPKTAEEKFNEAVKEGWAPNEVLNHMRNSKNDEYRSWVKQTWESPEAIPTPDGSLASRIPAELDPELKDKLRQRRSQRQEKMDTAAGNTFQVPDWMFSPEFLAGAAGTAAGLGTAYTSTGAHAGMTPMEAAKGAASTFAEDINQRLANQYKSVAPAAPAAPSAPVPTFTGNAQPTTLPTQQGYGATTINAPTGGPALPPAGTAPQPIAPAPVDPIQAARIREAQAKATTAEHNAAMAAYKRQQLESGPKTVASGKQAYTEQEHGFATSGGAASGGKQAKEATKQIAADIAALPDSIAATATPVEKATAVKAVQDINLKTGSGFPAHAGKAPPVEDISKFRMPAGGELGDLTKLPSNLAFVPGFGPGLNTARNTLGQEGAQALARQQSMPWGEDAATRARLAEFDQNRVGPALNREQRIAIGAPMPENTPGIKMKKGAKALGTVGALMALADLANASEKSEGNKPVGPSTSENGAAFGGYTSGKKYQEAKKKAEQADVNLLKDPKTAAVAMALLGTSPDQMGFSVLNPKYKEIMSVAEPAYYAGLPLSFLPGTKAKKIAGAVAPR